jgi:hypothetical protein
MVYHKASHTGLRDFSYFSWSSCCLHNPCAKPNKNLNLSPLSLYVDVTTLSGAEISLNDGVITPTNTVKERTADEEHIYYYRTKYLCISMGSVQDLFVKVINIISSQLKLQTFNIQCNVTCC